MRSADEVLRVAWCVVAWYMCMSSGTTGTVKGESYVSHQNVGNEAQAVGAGTAGDGQFGVRNSGGKSPGGNVSSPPCLGVGAFRYFSISSACFWCVFLCVFLVFRVRWSDIYVYH